MISTGILRADHSRQLPVPPVAFDVAFAHRRFLCYPSASVRIRHVSQTGLLREFRDPGISLTTVEAGDSSARCVLAGGNTPCKRQATDYA
jgi:hypothetical protein